ncbi:metal ABC transporter solute-binding protein, Zn/Mn family [Marisediminicola sp. LYQ134]|uniref:metal ABC transporter solute-binding protein, Zn/Mn family n=1 Tax=Marisediminicola sp. LYQ134 TaxID=3391061 RepID=UPI003983D974
MRSRLATSTLLISGVSIAALTLAGCAPAADPSGSDDARLQIVTSTDVYGDIAAVVAGDLADVTPIISGAAQDPHSYEATARDQLALSRADVVIENGGGYDPFIDTMLSASGSDDVVVLNASELSGLIDGDEHADEDHADDEHAEDDHDHADDDHGDDDHTDDDHDGHAHIEGFNEHVWYSFGAVDELAHELAHELGELDEANAETFESNYDDFAAELETLETRATDAQAGVDGAGAAITEPVPVYLLEAMGFVNRTPDAFSEAIEEGTDVSPAVLSDTLGLFDDGSVAILAYNEQTAGPETEQVRDAAEDAGVPVVSLTETLPDGESYLTWMSSNIDEISAAID